MATNKPFGCRPTMIGDGSPWNGRANRYYVPQADGNQYCLGDVVKSTNNADANGVPAVTKAAGTDTVRGIVVGVEGPAPNAVSLSGVVFDQTTTQAPATKTRDYYLWVADDPGIMFEIQDDGITTANLVAANANKNCSLTIAAPSNTVSPSATVINSSTIATTNTLNVKLMGLAQLPGNAFGAYGIWLARFNQHELQGGTTGV